MRHPSAGGTKHSLEALIAHEFPVTRNLIYLNHAAVSPWPRRTAEAVAHFASENAEWGARDYPGWLETEQRLREQLARLVGAASADDVALLKNTSEALSVVAHGFPWEPGNNVVISDEEFPSNRIVWQSLKPYGVQVREVRVSGVSDPESALIAAADGRTRVLSVSWVQYATGLRLNLERLGSECHRRGLALCVDGIQGLGALPCDVQAMHVDFFMADAHKWLLGPEGIAVFYCRPEWRGRLRLHQFGWHMVAQPGDYDRRDWQVAGTARRFECGSPNMLGIHALNVSIGLLQEIGAAEIESRVIRRSERLFERIRANPDLGLITDAAPGRYAGIVTFQHRALAPSVVYRRLANAGVVCAMRGGGVRFSPHFYTPLQAIDRAIEVASIQ